MPSAITSSGFAPTINTFLDGLKDSTLDASVESLTSLLKRRTLVNSPSCAKAIASIFKEVVRKYEWKNLSAVTIHMEEVGEKLDNAQPYEMPASNILRRVLALTRGEVVENRDDKSLQNTQPSTPISGLYSLASPIPESPATAALKLADQMNEISLLRHLQTSIRPPIMEQPSMFNLLDADPNMETQPSKKRTRKPMFPSSVEEKWAGRHAELKAEIIAGIDEIIDEIDQAEDQIAVYGPSQVKNCETIFLCDMSIEIQKFVLEVAKARKYLKIIVPRMDDKAKDEIQETFFEPVAKAGHHVQFYKASELMCHMSRAHRVFVSPKIVCINGGMFAAPGTRLIAKAAKAYKVPVICLTGVYKIGPDYPHDPDALVEMGNPSKVLPLHEARSLALDIKNPLSEYVPPKLIHIFITNIGNVSPASVSKVVADHYNALDINFNHPEFEED